MTYQSLIDPIIERFEQEPDRVVYYFWGEDDSRTTVTAADLHAGMLSYANALHRLGLRENDLAILVLNHSLDLVFSFFGAIYLGARPTIFPYFSPTHDAETYRGLVHTLVAQSNAAGVVTSADFEAPLAELLHDTGCRVLSVTDVKPVTDEDHAEALASYGRGEDIAFLQYTSGTTGLKKGVMLSHRAVLTSVIEMARYSDTRSDRDIIINWLPLYHDYGLICGVMCPVILNVPGGLLSPYKWVRRPALLFEMINEYGGTMCWMPNFALNHSVKAIRRRQIEGMSLATVRSFMSGAEPVRHDSQQAFFERFAAYGFREEALGAGYGMAENTLAVTVTPNGARNRVDWIDMHVLREEDRAVSADPTAPEAASFVSCGRPFGGAEIRIIGEDGSPVSERQVGNIWLRTPTLFSGYYQRPDLTAEVMHDGWYDTGDVGYMAEGELFVCGRKKDIIIVSGKNVYPKDIEAIARAQPGIKEDGVVAFGVANERMGSEGIVVIAEMARRLDEDARHELASTIRKRITAEMGLSVADVRVVKKGWIVKTQNAKISRSRNVEKYLDLKARREL